jgi:hypothetical protein
VFVVADSGHLTTGLMRRKRDGYPEKGSDSLDHDHDRAYSLQLRFNFNFNANESASIRKDEPDYIR